MTAFLLLVPYVSCDHSQQCWDIVGQQIHVWLANKSNTQPGLRRTQRSRQFWLSIKIFVLSISYMEEIHWKIRILIFNKIITYAGNSYVEKSRADCELLMSHVLTKVQLLIMVLALWEKKIPLFAFVTILSFVINMIVPFYHKKFQWLSKKGGITYKYRFFSITTLRGTKDRGADFQKKWNKII